MAGSGRVFCPGSTLTALQRELLLAFCERERRCFLTGGAVLAGFYFAHRETEDLDLFSAPGPDLADAARVLQEVAAGCGGQIAAVKTFSDYRRLLVIRGQERCMALAACS